jgi:preprotein translocase subunit SecG
MSLLAFETSQWLIGLMVVFFLFISLCMMLIVLIQRPQGGGIAGAFGGGGAEGAGQTAFGAKTGDVLTTVTIGIFVVFIGSAIALNYLVRPPKASDETSVTAPASNAPAAPAGGQAPTTTGTAAPAGAPASAAAPTTTPAPAPGTTPDADGKFRAESPAGSIESVVPVEVIPAGQPLPAGTPEPAPAPAPAPAANPGTTTPSTPPAKPQ